jgi:hypothetical protein
MKRLIGGKVWNRISIEIPDVESVSISLPPTEAVPTNTEQITADIPVVARNTEKLVELRVEIVGIASRVPRVTLALACSEGLYTLSHPVASSLIHIQHQPEHYTYLQLTIPLCY